MINKPLKILLVEDNATDKVLIERQIKKILSAPKILHLTELEEVKKSIALFDPDVVLSDYNLGLYSGLEILQYIKTQNKRIPLIFVTGTIDNEELAAESILTGAYGYLLKNNINQLHKKLLPYFEKIIASQEKENITSTHSKVFEEFQSYLNKIKTDNKIIRASYQEMKRALDTLKSLE